MNKVTNSKIKRSHSNSSLTDSTTTTIQSNVRVRLDDDNNNTQKSQEESEFDLESKLLSSSKNLLVSSHDDNDDGLPLSEQNREDQSLITKKETFIRPEKQIQNVPSSSFTAIYSNGDWQAVYDPQQAAYYFVNSVSGETTWTNPFISTSSSELESLNPKEFKSMNELGGIDPELAYLEPQTVSSTRGGGGGGGGVGGQYPPSFTARFNSRTGKFESDLNHDPNRVSQYARARTQANAYFDVEAWEKSLEQSNGRITGTSRDRQVELIKSGKKLSKVEITKFKEKKMEKK
ncbi:hypothetical protein CROQUDRAFT_659024, partial [Cronartium quercuum f. sp. fusiforme G11]